MKLLFVHEGYIATIDNNYYSLHYNNKMIKRYKTIADEVTFLTRENLTNQEEKLNKIDIPNFKFIGIDNYKSFGQWNKYLKVRKTVEEAVQSTDYLIARLPGDLGNLAIKYAKKYNKDYLIELVGCPWDALWNHSYLGKLIAPYLYLKTKKIVKNANYVIYVSSKFLQERYPTNGYSTNCSNVSLQDVNSSLKNKKLKRLKNLNNKKVMIGTIGALNLKYKGYEDSLEALKLIKDENLQFEYQIVGGGDESYLKSLIDKYNIKSETNIKGSITHDKVFEWLENIDIYIQPSRTEGLPRALIEAMSKACICIGSNAGGIPELLPETNIFKTKDPRDLKRVLTNSVMSGVDTVNKTFNESKKYEEEVIEKRRENFLKAFAQQKSYKN